MTKILSISNMKPSVEFPNYGVFIENFNSTLLRSHSVDVIAIKKTNNKFIKTKSYIGLHLCAVQKILLNRYGVIIVHSATHMTLLILVAKLFQMLRIQKVEIIVYIHGSDLYLDHVSSNIAKLFLSVSRNISISAANKIFVASKKMVNKLAVISEGTRKKIRVVLPTSIPVIFFANTNDVLTSKHRLVLAGRYEIGKDQDLFFEALKCRACDTYSIQCVGSGLREEIVKSSAEGLNVTFHDLLNHAELSKVFKNSDFLIFNSSLNEGLGLLVMEASAAGCIPVLLQNSGVAEHISHSVNGFVFTTTDEIADFLANIYEYNILDIGKIKRHAIENAEHFNKLFKLGVESNIR